MQTALPLIGILYLASMCTFSCAADDATRSHSVTATFSQSDVIIEVGEQVQLYFYLSGRLNDTATDSSSFLYFTYQEEAGAEITSKQRGVPVIQDLADVTAPSFNESASAPVPFTVIGLTAGHVIIGLNSTSPEFENRRDRFVRVRVIRSRWIDIVNISVGILYVICWSSSYYPQTWLNFTRRSVVGLNFDFVGLNILGFAVYSLFNVGLYWVQPLQSMYYARHPRGVIPVQLADCIFALHCLAITIIQGLQCLFYERGGQKLSLIGCLLLSGMTSFLLVSLVLAATWGPSFGLDWLQFVYFASYVKLAVTLTKYAPQAYMNYKRKSTWGWSIGQVYLDFAGGFLSIGQMILLAYNYSDWGSLLGDPTKLGLGIVSVVYDCLFFVQHYCLYGPSVGGVINVDPNCNSSADGTGAVNCEYHQLEKSTDEKSKLLP